MPRVAPVLMPLACLLACVCALAVPSFALGHASTGLGEGDRPLDPEAAAQLEDLQAEALEALPAETDAGSCRTAGSVAGLGRACRTDDGLFRVVVSPGVTVETHGADAPATEVRELDAAHLPNTQAALDGADASDIACVGGVNDKRVELIYAYPADRTNRVATIAPLLRQGLYRASAFVDAESQARDPNAGRRIPTLCDGAGAAVVTAVQLDALGGGGGVFGSIVSQLTSRGYPVATSNSSSPRRFMIFYDAPSQSGAAGVGQFYANDEAAATNPNNYGARYAVEFAWSGDRVPHWDVMLHETSHNMGAIADAAPDSSGGGHCNDGLDIMCYSDGGSTSSYNGGVCAQERYDCGGDSYFNPAPAPGSWLANHWNIASTTNAWLRPWDAGWDDGGTPDLDAPSVPSAPQVTAVGHTTLSVSWGASVDARSSVSYFAWVDSWNGSAWVTSATIEQIQTANLEAMALTSGTSYRIRIAARDEAGNQSAEASVIGATSSGPPEAPTSISVPLGPNGDTIPATWSEGSASSAISGYDAELRSVGDSTLVARRLTGRALTFTNLAPGTSYKVRVRTVAENGDISTWRTSTTVTTPGKLADGTTVGGGELPVATASLVRRSFTSLTFGWASSGEAARYDVTLSTSAGTLVKRLTGTTLMGGTFGGLVPGRSYQLQVVPKRADGARGVSGSVTAATLKDAVKPGATKVSGRAKGSRNWTIRWAAARDNAGVARYEVQRKVGRSWRTIARTRATSRAVTIAKVPRGATALRVRAIDVAGNAGPWAGYTARRR